MHWYAISTKPRQEKQAEFHIKRQGIECFLPMLKESRIIRRASNTVIGPLFPGYLFARFDVAEHYRAVTYARGVRKIVEFGSSAAIVDDKIIESIRLRLENGLVVLHNEQFRMGQVVRIQDGPLRGLEAMFEKEMTGSQRAILLLKALSYQARVEVNLGHIVNL
jgi:transcriptional antiterminator RfaH